MIDENINFVEFPSHKLIAKSGLGLHAKILTFSLKRPVGGKFLLGNRQLHC